MHRKIIFTERAAAELAALGGNPRNAGLFKQVVKTIMLLETNLKHPSLNTHKFDTLAGLDGEEIFEAYAQTNTPGAYRVFWHYGPDETTGKKRVPVITVFAITPHP